MIQSHEIHTLRIQFDFKKNPIVSTNITKISHEGKFLKFCNLRIFAIVYFEIFYWNSWNMKFMLISSNPFTRPQSHHFPVFIVGELISLGKSSFNILKENIILFILFSSREVHSVRGIVCKTLEYFWSFYFSSLRSFFYFLIYES